MLLVAGVKRVANRLSTMESSFLSAAMQCLVCGDEKASRHLEAYVVGKHFHCALEHCRFCSQLLRGSYSSALGRARGSSTEAAVPENI